jgi:hypothetical protein
MENKGRTPTQLRRIDDYLMTEVIKKVESIEQKLEEHQKSNDTTLEEIRNAMVQQSEDMAKISRALFGEKDKGTGEQITQGMKPQHDEMYRDYAFNKRMKALFVGSISLNLVWVVIQFGKWIEPFIARLLGK